MGIPSIYAVTITSKLCDQRKSLLRRWLTMRKLRNRALFNALDCIIVNNATMRELMRQMGVTSRIEVIRNGVNLQRFHPAENRQDFTQIREALGIPPEAMMVTTVGAVMPRKGSDPVAGSLGAFTRKHAWGAPGICRATQGPSGFRPWEITRRDLEQLIVDSGAPGQVHFTGLVDNVEAYLHASDVFVLPSQREGMPNSVLEAMACGVPVIITPFLGLSDDLGKAGEHYLLAGLQSRFTGGGAASGCCRIPGCASVWRYGPALDQANHGPASQP